MSNVSSCLFRLPMKEQTRVEEILRKALLKERGEPVDDIIIPGMSGSESDGDNEELEEEEEEEEEEDGQSAVVYRLFNGVTLFYMHMSTLKYYKQTHIV